MTHFNLKRNVWSIALLVCSHIASASSSRLIQPPISDFFALDRQHLWVLVRNAEDRYFLFVTADGGATWTHSSAPAGMWRVFFNDATEGWGIVGSSLGTQLRTFLVHSTNAGKSWERVGGITEDADDKPTGVAFDTRQHGWIVGEGYMGKRFILETADGGKHWRRLNWDTYPASGLYGIRLYDGKAYTWSGGAEGSGIFELRPSALPKRISDRQTMNFAFGPNGSLVSVGQVTVSRRTADAAAWEQVLETSEFFRDMSFSDAQHGCVAGGEIYCTDDGGRTWTSRPLPYASEKSSPDPVYQIYLLDPSHAWAVTEDKVFVTEDAAYTWRAETFFDTEAHPLRQPHTY